MSDRISRLTVFIFQTPHTVSCVLCVGALSDPHTFSCVFCVWALSVPHTFCVLCMGALSDSSHGLLCVLCGSTLRLSHLLLRALCGSTLGTSYLLLCALCGSKPRTWSWKVKYGSAQAPANHCTMFLRQCLLTFKAIHRPAWGPPHSPQEIGHPVICSWWPTKPQETKFGSEYSPLEGSPHGNMSLSQDAKDRKSWTGFLGGQAEGLAILNSTVASEET